MFRTLSLVKLHRFILIIILNVFWEIVVAELNEKCWTLEKRLILYPDGPKSMSLQYCEESNQIWIDLNVARLD